MPVSLKSSGGGSVTMDVPSTASTFTLTLPASTGTALTTATAVTVAQGGTGLATLTANNVVLGNGTGTPNFVAPGTNGNVMTSNGTTWTSTALPTSGFTQVSPVATTSGTALDFTGIPSTAKVIIVNFNTVSTNGSSPVQVQVGYAGPTIVTSGYVSATVAAINGAGSSGNNYSTGFYVGYAGLGASNDRSGSFLLTAMSSTLWTCHGIIISQSFGVTMQTAGVISMGGTLDRLRLTTVNGTDAFDAGSWSIVYSS
jgi:hypothetical protein